MARDNPPRRPRYLTRAECDAMTVGQAINMAPLFTATEKQLADAAFAICGKPETPAQTRARREAGMDAYLTRTRGEVA